MSIYTPYTYLIGWSKHNKWYYGARWAKECNPNDLWVSYYTSSLKVKEYRKQYGEPDVIQVRKTFLSPESTRLWEEKVQRRLKVIGDKKWLNKQYGGIKFCSDGDPETGKKISKSNKGKEPWNKGKRGIYSAETLMKMRDSKVDYVPWNKDKPMKDSTKDLLRNLNTGKKQSVDTIYKRTEPVICPCCGKVGSKNLMKRWHFDNCRNKNG